MVVSKTRRKLAERFRQAGAFAADRAVALTGLSHPEESRLRRFVEHNIVRETAPGTYWLDRDRYRDYLAHQRRLILLGILVVLIVLFFVVEIAGGS